ncbi:NAD(P)-binding protein [Poronia punctata]|nr:NAD(P)-binding protein [Poronia punctata]
MGNLLILTDTQIHQILINLTREEAKIILRKIYSGLAAFALHDERYLQPKPTIVNRPEGSKCLFRPFTSPTSIGTKIIVQPKDGGDLHGMIAVCDAQGIPTGILNAEEVTGYRTSMAALIPFWSWRTDVRKVVIFGAGKQALWHLRLMLLSRGDEIEEIVVVNRTVERAKQLVEKIKGENEQRWKSKAEISVLLGGKEEGKGEDSLIGRLRAADAIFCTTGAREPLFSAEEVLGGKGNEGNERGPYISAVGSWQSDMIELDPALLQHVVDNKKSADSKAARYILVDDRDTVVPHTGEFIQSKLGAEHVVELGTVDMNRDGEEMKHLSEGLLVYKSIGVGTMDLAASNVILEFAKKQGLGTVVPEF